jgi:hypothetical protein
MLTNIPKVHKIKLPNFCLIARSLFCLFFILCFCSQNNTWADEHDAHIKVLANGKEWLALLHYHSTITSPSGLYSLVDDSKYFLAPNGKYDSTSELKANILAFKADPSEYNCRFPLRTIFLIQNLSDINLAHAPKCTELESWLVDINGTHASLVFPSSYLNNPASAFGHTLLKISPPPGSSSDLLHYALNYAAATMGEDPLNYALKGVFGGYNGYFGIEPFYEKVKKYSSSENRDIWEYSLNFSPDEVRKLLLHIWELRDINFDYYYFDENCSFFLLELLQVVRPTAKLIESYKPWIVPATTIRIIKENGMIEGDAIYRPSSLRSLRSKLKDLSGNEQNIAKKVAVVKRKETRNLLLKSTEPNRRPYILDVAIDYLAYRQPESKQKRYELFHERSLLGSSSFQNTLAPSSDPLKGHREFRLGLSQGIVDHENYTDLRFRPVSHDLYDSPVGYELGSQIELLDTTIRTFSNGDAELDRLKIIDIKSLSPRDALIRPKSWSLTFAYDSLSPKFAPTDKSIYLEGGVGATTALQNTSALFYSLIGSKIEFDAAQIGPSIELGSLHYFNYGVVSATGKSSYLFGKEQFADCQAGLAIALFTGQNSSIRLENFFRQRYHKESNESHLSLFFYY